MIDFEVNGLGKPSGIFALAALHYCDMYDSPAIFSYQRYEGKFQKSVNNSSLIKSNFIISTHEITRKLVSFPIQPLNGDFEIGSETSSKIRPNDLVFFSEYWLQFF